MVKKKNLSEKLGASKMRKIRQPSKMSKFEQKFTKEKHQVMGRKKSKSSTGQPVATKARAFENRLKTLGAENSQFFKDNTFMDRRLAENSTQMSKEEKMLKRLTAERRKRYNKEKFNLNEEDDDGKLTHYGQNLADIEKFELRGVDGQASDDEDGNLNANMNFGGGEENDNKSRKQIINEMISKSKQSKYEKQSLKEEQHALTEQLDDQWRQLVHSNLINFPKNNDQLESDKEKSDFDTLVRELTFERRTAPAQDAKKSEKEMKEREKEKLEKLEQEKRDRMELKENFATPMTHFNPDDMDSNCYLPDFKKDDQEDDEDDEEKDQESLINDDENFDQEFKPWKKSSKIKNSDRKAAVEEQILSPKILESYSNLKPLLEKSVNIENFFEKILSNFNPSLKPGNKELLKRLFLYLLRYFDEKSAEDQIDFKLLDKLTAFLFKLKDYGHENAAKSFRALLKRHRQNFFAQKSFKLGKLRSIPSRLICFFRLLPHLFPTSDSYHPISTPCFLFWSEILQNLKPKNGKDVGKGLILATILLEFVKDSKKFAPDLLFFIERIKNMDFLKQSISEEPGKLSLSDLLNKNDAQVCPSSLVYCISQLMNRLSNLYAEKASFPEIFPEHQLKGSQRTKLQFSHDKDQNLQKFDFYEPKIEQNFNPDRKKHQFTKGPRAERAKLKRQYKNEYKGAVRELRRDNEFLARRQLEAHLAKDRERTEKTKKLMSSLMGQESDYKKMKKDKK